MSQCYMNDNRTNTLLQSMEPFNKVPSRLTEKNVDPVLLNFKKQMLGLPSDGQILATKPRYFHYS